MRQQSGRTRVKAARRGAWRPSPLERPAARGLMRADSDEAARLYRDDCAHGFLDDAAPL